MGWLGRQDSNLGMAVPKTAALPLGDAPPSVGVYIIGRAAAGNSVLRGSADPRKGAILPLRRFPLAAIRPASREFLGVGV